MPTDQLADTQRPWLSVGQTALRIRRSGSRVRQLCSDGALRARMTALGRLIDPNSVDALLRARNAAGSPATIKER